MKLHSRDVLFTAFSIFKSGVFGFAIFFSVLIFTKFLGVFFGTLPSFEIEFADILLSSIGFFLIALIKFLEEFKQN